MLLAGQNSYSFTVLSQVWGGESNKKRKAEIVRQDGRLRFSTSTAPTEEAEIISLPAWVSNTLKCPFRTTHAAKQQAHNLITHNFFLVKEDKELGRLLLLCWPRLDIPHISVSATDTDQSRAALLWSGPSARWLGMLSAGHHLPHPMVLMDYQAFSCSSAQTGILPWQDDWTVITGKMGGPNFWFSAWNSHFVHFHVILGDSWHMMEYYMTHLNTRHMEFHCAFIE